MPTELLASLAAVTALFAIFVVVTEPSVKELVPTIPPTSTILALPSSFFMNSLPSWVFIANSPNSKSETDGVLF